MQSDHLTISVADTLQASEDRFERFRLIGWWDQQRLRDAKVLVIGAGALGNEIIKNLALLGIGNLFVADLDLIENSNLSRSVLYRESNNGESKAQVAARTAKDIYPDINVHYFHGNVVHDLGLGVFRWADVILAGLDNREARLAINRNCWRVGRPWIDGAIEQIQGCARVFVPDGPCYECTMSELDWKLLQGRRSCNLLSRAEMEEDKTSTTPTTSSIIAGVQCQEAVKLLHGLPTIAGKGWIYDGLSAESYLVAYQRKDECYSHESLADVVRTNLAAASATVGELLACARGMLGHSVELELARDVLEKLICPGCGFEERVFTSLGKTTADKAFCPHCENVRREVVTFFKIRGNESFLDRPLCEIGVPSWDIVIARTVERAIGLELSADAAQVLGPIAGEIE